MEMTSKLLEMHKGGVHIGRITGSEVVTGRKGRSTRWSSTAESLQLNMLINLGEV